MALLVSCPICRVQISWEGNPYRPFCSERCRLIDLGAWSEGKYRIPGKKIERGSKKENGSGEKGSSD